MALYGDPVNSFQSIPVPFKTFHSTPIPFLFNSFFQLKIPPKIMAQCIGFMNGHDDTYLTVTSLSRVMTLGSDAAKRNASIVFSGAS